MGHFSVETSALPGQLSVEINKRILDRDLLHVIIIPLPLHYEYAVT